MMRLNLLVVLLVLSAAACSKSTHGVDSGSAGSDFDSQRVDFEPVEVEPPSDPHPVPLDPSAGSGYTPVGTVSNNPTPRTHVIRKGDTYWSIARQYYGDGRRAQDIAQANPSLVPTKLPVGKEIILP